MTVLSYLQSWIGGRTIRLAPSTISGYNGLVRNYIEPSKLSSMELGDVEPEDIIDILAPICADGKTRAAQLVQALLTAAFKDAGKRRIIRWNPMDCLDKVRHYGQMTPWLTAEQAARVLAAARLDTTWYLAFVLGFGLGLRRGEILALRWDDIDLDGGFVHVRRQRVQVERRVIESVPKTASSVRTLPLCEQLANALERCRDGSAVYVVERRGQPVTADQLRHALRRYCSLAGVPVISPHGMRHSLASAAAACGSPVQAVQRLLGHRHYSTTADVYTHVDENMARSAEMSVCTRLEIV